MLFFKKMKQKIGRISGLIILAAIEIFIFLLVLFMWGSCGSSTSCANYGVAVIVLGNYWVFSFVCTTYFAFTAKPKNKLFYYLFCHPISIIIGY